VRRLYLHIYLSVLAILAVFVALSSLTWSAMMQPHEEEILRNAAPLVAELLPPPDRAPEEVRDALRRIGIALQSDLSVYAPDGELIAAQGKLIPLPGESDRNHFCFAFALPDGRRLLVRHPFQHGFFVEISLGLAILAGTVAIGAYPLVRRLTRRLERLRTRVEALGAGDLAARVDVEGRDEIASLAESFNAAAARIERLVESQRTLLAGVSHELRTPLARIRVAAELLAAQTSDVTASGPTCPELRAAIERDVAELDDGIGELLLASRLDAQPALERAESVDLLALAAEEAARCGADASGAPVAVRGDARMLRRLVRNLLENARRHGGDAAIEVSVSRAGSRARLAVDDRGPGVADAERERIFEAFYRPAGAQGGGGLGLGLALVRRIARHHGGDARCLAREGGGTRFEVELPASP
jgi:signal transduction histidine kinase